MFKLGKKGLFIFIGWIFMGLGVLGALLPVLPTTPFILLSAFFFSKSSKKWHEWLVRNKVFGPIIKDWQTYGAVSLKAKLISLISMLALFGYSLLYVELHWAIKACLVFIFFSVQTYIWTRPFPVEETPSNNSSSL